MAKEGLSLGLTTIDNACKSLWMIKASSSASALACLDGQLFIVRCSRILPVRVDPTFFRPNWPPQPQLVHLLLRSHSSVHGWSSSLLQCNIGSRLAQFNAGAFLIDFKECVWHAMFGCSQLRKPFQTSIDPAKTLWNSELNNGVGITLHFWTRFCIFEPANGHY